MLVYILINIRFVFLFRKLVTHMSLLNTPTRLRETRQKIVYVSVFTSTSLHLGCRGPSHLLARAGAASCGSSRSLFFRSNNTILSFLSTTATADLS